MFQFAPTTQLFSSFCPSTNDDKVSTYRVSSLLPEAVTKFKQLSHLGSNA